MPDTLIAENEVDESGEASYAKPLGRLSILSYGVGHMLNDITSSCWFTYLLLFLTGIGLSPRDAATVMLVGQSADGLATIFVGELIDKFGHFKLWHAGGSLLVVVSFSLVFGGCVPCSQLGIHSAAIRTILYSTFAAVFNMGWAATQVSHMSMVNHMTFNATSRVVLSSCRNAFTMVANLSLYGIAFYVFSSNMATTSLDIEKQYSWIAYLSFFLGCCFVAIFLFGTKEPRLNLELKKRNPERLRWKHWLNKVLYHQIAGVYVLSRLVTNVSQALLALYLVNELRMGQSSKALVPAITYISSFAISVALQEFQWTGQRLKIIFSIGAFLWLISGATFFFLPRNLHNIMYPLSIVVGIANALMTVTAISMEGVLVGKDLNSCGFIYGSLSFLDKTICGLVLYLLEFHQGYLPRYSPRLAATDNIPRGNSSLLIRCGFGLVPAMSSLLGAVITYTMDLHNVSPKCLVEPLLE